MSAAHVCLSPAGDRARVADARDANGQRRAACATPSPIWPWSLRPQHQTLPSARTRHACPPPVATSVIALSSHDRGTHASESSPARWA
jgi:hypothetical protein